jgi:hypothetical protein
MLPTSVKKHAQPYTDGYPSLSAFVSSDRDGTSVIFKKFNRLAARNMLLLQSELAELEYRLDMFDREDEGSRETLQTLRNWEDYKTRNPEDSDRMKLLKQIRSTMKEYRKFGYGKGQGHGAVRSNGVQQETLSSPRANCPHYRHQIKRH